MDMEELDFVEEDLETSIKVLFLGPTLSGKSTIISTLTSSPSPTKTLSVEYNEHTMLGGGRERLMLYDTPGKFNFEGPSCKNVGAVVITVDLPSSEDYDVEVKGIGVTLGLLKRNVTPLPPCIVCFTKWDKAEGEGWGDRGSMLRKAYEDVLETCDAFVGGMYSVVRLDCRNEEEVSKLAGKVVGNYRIWGRGTQDVFADAGDVGGTGKKKKKKKKKKKVVEEEGEGEDKNGSVGFLDSNPQPKQLFGSTSPTAEANGGGAGEEVMVRKPRKRRTNGKKSLVTKAKDARKRIQEEGCMQS